MSPQEHTDRLHGIAAQFEAALRDASRDGLHVDVTVRSHEVATVGVNTHYFRKPFGLGVLVTLPFVPTRVDPALAMHAVGIHGDSPCASNDIRSPLNR